MFANLNQGSTVYVLQTNDGLKYGVATIESKRPSFQYSFNNGALLDITVNMDGNRREFSGVQANSSVSMSTNYILTDSKEAMVSQIQNRYQMDLDAIDKYDFHKSDAEECKSLLGKLNPQFAKESAMDNALTDLTSRVDQMQNEFGDIKNDMKQVLNLLTNKKD